MSSTCGRGGRRCPYCMHCRLVMNQLSPDLTQPIQFARDPAIAPPSPGCARGPFPPFTSRSAYSNPSCGPSLTPLAETLTPVVAIPHVRHPRGRAIRLTAHTQLCALSRYSPSSQIYTPAGSHPAPPSQYCVDSLMPRTICHFTGLKTPGGKGSPPSTPPETHKPIAVSQVHCDPWEKPRSLSHTV